MESGWDWEQKTLINELTQGMELAKQLRFHLNSTSSIETREFLVQRILSSYEKALLVLKWSGSVGQPQPVEPTIALPESPISISESPPSDDFNRGSKDPQDRKDVSKKRKTVPRWTDQVRVCSESGLEGPHDGYSWRKYGQKDILGAKYPRSYYRCTYRNVQNCWATKLMQRSDEDPSVFEITYKGTHTCSQANHSIPAPSSPGKQEQKQNTHHNGNQQTHSKEVILNFRTGLSVNTEDLDNNQMPSPFSFPPASLESMKGENQIFTPSILDNNNFTGSYSPSFLSPATSESKYLPASPCGMNSIGGIQNVQRSESDPTEIISTNTSATNSPILDLDFSLDFGSFPLDNPWQFSI